MTGLLAPSRLIAVPIRLRRRAPRYGNERAEELLAVGVDDHAELPDGCVGRHNLRRHLDGHTGRAIRNVSSCARTGAANNSVAIKAL